MISGKKCCFLTGILSVKFQTHVFFGGLQYEALLQPPLNPVYCEYPTWGCMLRVHSVTLTISLTTFTNT